MLVNLLALAIFFSGSSDTAFEFYLKEFESNYLTKDDPMLKLIENRLAESVFETSDQAEFQRRLSRISELYRLRTDHAQSFKRLDRALKREFEDRLHKAKRRRWLYAAGGALVGALVSIPIAKAISAQSSALWIAIPVGALSGAGAGFLLGNLMETPKYSYASGMLSGDIEQGIRDLDELMK